MSGLAFPRDISMMSYVVRKNVMWAWRYHQTLTTYFFLHTKTRICQQLILFQSTWKIIFLRSSVSPGHSFIDIYRRKISKKSQKIHPSSYFYSWILTYEIMKCQQFIPFQIKQNKIFREKRFPGTIENKKRPIFFFFLNI